jgi:hypothetical protein
MTSSEFKYELNLQTVRISILSDQHINDAFEQNVINIPHILTMQWCDEYMIIRQI